MQSAERTRRNIHNPETPDTRRVPRLNEDYIRVPEEIEGRVTTKILQEFIAETKTKS